MTSNGSEKFDAGVGATQALSLRVSVATLVRVVFENPPDGKLMLALERTATLLADISGPSVSVKAQPFGGAVRFRSLTKLRALISGFHFDSERSRSEQDFRIFIRPADWEPVRQFCWQHFSHVDEFVLESDPARELAEEFTDALEISLRPNQYIQQPVGAIVENEPARTENIHAPGHLTARVYRIFEARIIDPSLSRAIMANSENRSNQDLHRLALEDARNGGKGRANAILALPMELVRAAYLAKPPEMRGAPITFEKNRLDGNVSAVLEGVAVSKHRRLC